MFFSKKAKDPVCGMKIKVNGSTLRSHYQGTDYYLCSSDCLKQFEKSPQRYVHDPEKSVHQNDGHHQQEESQKGHDHHRHHRH